MADIDTEGGIWYQWFVYFSKQNSLSTLHTSLLAYPNGYSLIYAPFQNLIYDIHYILARLFTQGTIQDILFINNISSLLTYPLAGICAYLLCVYLTKNKLASFVGGFCYAFFHYFVLMGRGQMSINHIWPIPLYILSLCMFLDKRTPQRLIFSVLIFAFMFYADPYYAFFCGLVSPVIVCTRMKLTKEFWIKIAVYYLLVFVLTFTTNIDTFIKQSYLFNKSDRVIAGKVSTMKGELLSTQSWFQRGQYSYPETEALRPNVNFPRYFIVFVSLTSVLFIRKRWVSTFMVMYILSFLLSHYVEYTYVLNEMYFRYFEMFRGVARMISILALSESILITLAISNILERFYQSWQVKSFVFILAIIILISRTNDLPLYDKSWLIRTSLIERVMFWDKMKDGISRINVLMPYPYSLGAVSWGLPQTYQLIDQTMHSKQLASGVSPFDRNTTRLFQDKIKSPNSVAIDLLSNNCINGIITYNRLLNANEKELIENHEADGRIRKITSNSVKKNSDYITLYNLSMDVTVYEIIGAKKNCDIIRKEDVSTHEFFSNVAHIIRITIVSAALVYVGYKKHIFQKIS